MNTLNEEDILILEQKLKEICSEYQKLENEVNKLKTQAEQCVQELNMLRSPTMRKVKLYNCSEKLDRIYGILIKLNYELNISNDDVLNVSVMPGITHTSVETSTNSLKYLAGDNPWNFWLQENSSDVKVLYKLLIEKFENGLLKSCLHLPAVGESVCYAERRRLFRGVVTQHLENERLKVIDVDTSCFKILPLIKVYQVDEDVCELPAQAIKCCVSEDIENYFMWSSDLGTLFTDVLRNGNLHVKICKQLSGLPPQFVVEIRVINDEEEGHVDLKEWICERVLPELKDVYVEGVETLCDFLSTKALDPYFQDQSSNVDVQPDDILQSGVKSIENLVETSLMLHTYSSSETINVSDTTTKPQSESLATNVSSFQKIKSPSVADMLERSVTAGVHREVCHLPIIADDKNNSTEVICTTSCKIDKQSEDKKYSSESSKRVEVKASEIEEYQKETSKKVVDDQLGNEAYYVKETSKKVEEGQSKNKEYLMVNSIKVVDKQSEHEEYLKDISKKVEDKQSEKEEYLKDNSIKVEDKQSVKEEYLKENSEKVEDKQSENEEYRMETSKKSEDEQSENEEYQKEALKNDENDRQSENEDYQMETAKKVEDERSENKVNANEFSKDVKERIKFSRDQVSKLNSDYQNNCNDIEISNCDDQCETPLTNKVSDELIKFFSNTNHNKVPLDKVINNVDFENLADKLASNEFALFNKKLTAVMPTFDSQDLLNHKTPPTSPGSNNEHMADETEPCDNSDNVESRSKKLQSEISDKLLFENSVKELKLISAQLNVLSMSEAKITSKRDVSSSDKIDKDGTNINKFDKESSVSSNAESLKSNETYYSELSEETDSLNDGSKLKNYPTSNKSDGSSEGEIQKSKQINPFDSRYFKCNKSPRFNNIYNPMNQMPMPIMQPANSTPFYNYSQIAQPFHFNLSTPQQFPFQAPPPCHPYNQPLMPFNPPSGIYQFHQPDSGYYNHFHNHLQQSPQRRNVNPFQGQNFQYSAPNTKTQQSPHIQWSNGVNKPEIPPQPNNSETSEPKVSSSESVAAEICEERNGVVEKKEFVNNDLVLQPLCNVSNGFSVLDAENYQVKLKHPSTLLKPNENMQLMMSHIESPGEFYIHVVVPNNLFIDKPHFRLRDDMFERYNNSELVVSESWEDAKNKYGTYCACKWPKDDYWYRVEVIDWNYDGHVLVFFVDYGNRDEVPLPSIQPLLKEFTQLAMMAQPCHLANVFPTDSVFNIWSDEATSFFKSVVSYREDYKAVVEPSKSQQSSNSLAIILLLPDQGNEIISMNDLLVREGYAKSKRKISQQSTNTSVGDSEHGESSGNSSAKTPSMDEEDIEWENFNPLEEEFKSSANCFNMDQECANVAVTGYKGRDNSNTCRFFAEKGKCWKNICRKEHVFKSDKTVAKPFCGLILPDVGDVVLLKITHIQSINKFYGQLQQQTNLSDNEEEETLETLSDYLNRRKNIREMKLLLEPPEAGDLVLAKSSDGFWFRARVLTQPDTDSEVEVMFLDYGTEELVYEQDLRQIEPRYLHLPFQAVECILANVCPSSDERKTEKGFNILNKNLTGQTLYAKIHLTDPALCRLEVFLKDNQNVDVGEWLASQGFCKPIDL